MRDNPWKGLPPGGAGTLSVLRISVATTLEAFWARKPDGRLALLITLQCIEDVPVELPTLRGVDILVMQPEGQLQLVLASTGDWEMFHTLSLDLLSASNVGRDEPQALQFLFARLRRWQRLLSKGGGKVLDEREVRGLIGELLFLRDRLLPLSGATAVECWQGPMGLPQDFVHDGRLIEVKTFAAGSHPSVRIASAEQLTSVDAPLFLHLVCLVRQEGALTLPALVEEVRLVIAVSPAHAEAFDDRLLTMGYLDLPEYRSMAYAVTSVSDYEVRDGFPRLTVPAIPAGVVDVSYSIQLSHMRPFAVSSDVVTGSAGETA
jgi:hypothetical protein